MKETTEIYGFIVRQDHILEILEFLLMLVLEEDLIVLIQNFGVVVEIQIKILLVAENDIILKIKELWKF